MALTAEQIEKQKKDVEELIAGSDVGFAKALFYGKFKGDLLFPAKGWVMRMLVDSDHTDGFEQYDKVLYDRLLRADAPGVRAHLFADPEFRDRCARFLENHDEPRAAATFSTDAHQAAAVITFLSPGLRFFHQGQFEGPKKRISPHLCRGPAEPVDQKLKQF